MTEGINVTRPLVLPRVTVQSVSPSLRHKGKIYAYDVEMTFCDGKIAVVDARQLSADIAAFPGQTAMAGIYIVAFLAVATDVMHAATWTGRYLGMQNSIAFFPEILSRHLALENNQGDDDEDVFQDDYDQAGEDYLGHGFPLGSYQQVPMIETNQGVFFLGLQAQEQLSAAAIACGDNIAFDVKTFSLASFNPV